MKKLLLAFAVCILSSSSFATTIVLKMSYDTIRDFIVHFPPGFTNSQHLPLVLNLHGYGSNAAQQEFYSDMDVTSDANQFIVCYPNGLSSQWNSGFTPPYNGGTDDVGFISKIIDTLSLLYNIDLNRVYACGMSNGGFQSYRLACDLEDRIAAIASITGVISDLTALNCVLSRKVPVLQIHGTEDPLVPYIGRAGIKSVEETINFWLGKNQCTATSDTVRYPDIDPNDSSTVERIDYKNCADGTEVIFYKITGGGHTWPDAPFPYIYGPTNHDFDGSQEIWDFFNRFTLSGPTAVQELKQKDFELHVYPNPSSGDFELGISNYDAARPLNAAIFDISGRKIVEQQIVSSVTRFKLSGFEKGIYLLKIEGEGFAGMKRIVKE